MVDSIQEGFWIALFASAIRLSMPLLFAAYGGLFSERSGIINIGLEGIMLIGAFAAAVGNLAFASPWMGVLMAVLTSCSFALLHALASIRWKSNQVVSGMAINILAFGLTSVVCKSWYGTTSATPLIPQVHQFQNWSIPIIEKIPFFGPIVGVHTPIVFFGLASVFLVHYWCYYTPWGLRLRAVGEHPEACSSVGISIVKTRYFALVVCGIFCGLGGAFLSIGNASGFSKNMTAGRGFIALTALIFGKWKPIPTFLACLLFGFTDALQIRMQGVSLPYVGEVAPQFVQILPYLVTIVVLAGFIGSSKPPQSLGLPYTEQN